MNIKDILINFFDLLDSAEIKVDSNVIHTFKMDIVRYFDSFMELTIKFWYVNMENIMKYFINNYRCLKTFQTLIN
jgi:hypothetical protein